MSRDESHIGNLTIYYKGKNIVKELERLQEEYTNDERNCLFLNIEDIIFKIDDNEVADNCTFTIDEKLRIDYSITFYNGGCSLEEVLEEGINDLLKTSENWFKMYPKIKILDPDGWNRVDYDYSWYKELITKETYLSRLSRSTCSFNLKTSILEYFKN